MKRIILIMALTVSLGYLSNAYAYQSWKDDGGSCDGSSSCSYCNECECSDPNYARNPCISPSDYCQLFGNPGSMR